MEASPKFDSSPVAPLRRGLLNTQSDATLCGLAARGNSSAFDTIHRRYHRRIFVYVYGLLGRTASAEDAEDITQDAFHSAFHSLANRRQDGSVKAWLYTIARNKTFDHIRAQRIATVEIGDDATATADTEQIVENRMALTWLLAAIESLPERQREALVLRELGGLSYDEIAVTIGASEASVKQLLSRAREAVTNAAAAQGVRAPRDIGRAVNAAVPVGGTTAMGAKLAVALGFGGAGTLGAGGGWTVTKLAVGGVVAAALLGGGTIGLTGALSGSDAGGSGPDGTPDLQPTLQPLSSNSDGGDRNANGKDGDQDGGRSGPDKQDDDSRSDRHEDDRSEDHGGNDRSGSRDGTTDDGDTGDSQDDSSSESGEDRSGSGGGDDDPPSQPESGNDDGDSPDQTDEPEDEPREDHSGSGSSDDDSSEP